MIEVDPGREWARFISREFRCADGPTIEVLRSVSHLPKRPASSLGRLRYSRADQVAAFLKSQAVRSVCHIMQPLFFSCAASTQRVSPRVCFCSSVSSGCWVARRCVSKIVVAARKVLHHISIFLALPPLSITSAHALGRPASFRGHPPGTDVDSRKCPEGGCPRL